MVHGQRLHVFPRVYARKDEGVVHTSAGMLHSGNGADGGKRPVMMSRKLLGGDDCGDARDCQGSFVYDPCNFACIEEPLPGQQQSFPTRLRRFEMSQPSFNTLDFVPDSLKSILNMCVYLKK